MYGASWNLLTFCTFLNVTCTSYTSFLCIIDNSSSGVTRVGDTRGGNWGCYPSIFSWKSWQPFLVASSAVSPLFIFSWKSFFAHHCHFLLISLGCHLRVWSVVCNVSHFLDLIITVCCMSRCDVLCHAGRNAIQQPTYFRTSHTQQQRRLPSLSSTDLKTVVQLYLFVFLL